MTDARAPDPAEARRLAAIRYAGGVPIDELLRAVADRLAAAGIRLGGLLQEATAENGECCALMHLRDLRDGSLVTISQDLGAGAKGCRLDPAALAEVAARLEATLDDDVELLVLNRFGKAEAEGNGLRAIIQQAAAAGIPILLAVRDDYAEAWARFHDGLGIDLPADRDAVLRWCGERLGSPVLLRSPHRSVRTPDSSSPDPAAGRRRP